MTDPSHDGGETLRKKKGAGGTRGIVALLLLSHVGLLSWSAWSHSPVFNEAGHLSAGLSHLSLGRFELFRVNPPLIRVVAALPVATLSPATDWRHYDADPLHRTEHPVGLDFLVANGPRAFWLVTLARWACLPFALFGGYLCFRWARDLYGDSAGLVALTLWCFSPMVLGHASLITPDAHAATLGVAASYAFWLWLRGPQWSQALVVGLLLGMAELCKFTLLVFYPVGAFLWLLYRGLEADKRSIGTWLREMGMVATMVASSLYVVNAGYLFQGSFTPLGNYRFQSLALTGAATLDAVSDDHRNRFHDSWLARLPVPLPSDYVQGIDAQKLDFERGMRSYWYGQWQDRGCWYYYLYAWGVKTPLGTWLMILLAAGVTMFRKGYTAAARDELFLLVPAAAILALVSSQTGFSIHSRYTIPALPFVLIWGSKVARAFSWGHYNVAVAVVFGVVGSVGSSLCSFPHSLSYFNELAGGPLGGRNHLLDSNLSWGQDLFYLKQWLNAHPQAAPFQLVYFGQIDPRLADIRFSLPSPGSAASDGNMPWRDKLNPLLPGWYGIDVNHLQGSDLLVADGTGHWRWFPAGAFCHFQQFRPVAMAGYSIYIFHITAEEAERAQCIPGRQARGSRTPETTQSERPWIEASSDATDLHSNHSGSFSEIPATLPVSSSSAVW